MFRVEIYYGETIKEVANNNNNIKKILEKHIQKFSLFILILFYRKDIEEKEMELKRFWSKECRGFVVLKFT